MSKKITHEQRNATEEVLRRYPRFAIEENYRKIELSQNDNVDENVGGGKAQNKRNTSVEDSIIRVIEDPVLRVLDHNHKVIEAALNQVDDDQRKIIQMSYFNRFTRTTIDQMTVHVNMSKSSIIRFKNEFIEYIYPELWGLDV